MLAFIPQGNLITLKPYNLITLTYNLNPPSYVFDTRMMSANTPAAVTAAPAP